MKDAIVNEQYNRLFLFYDHAKNIIKQKMDQAPSYGANNRPLIVVNKAAVKAAEVLYEYSSRTTALLFDDIEAIKIENDSTNISNNLSTKKSFFEEESILLIMASPILSKAWFSNVLTGLPYTVQNGIGDKRHLVGARKETLMKTPPCIIRTDKDKLAALESININIDEYEHIYMNSPLPTNMLLTDETIKLILSDNAYIPVLHLFNDIRIEQEMERRIAAHVVQHEFFKGKKQYCIISSSQRVNNDGTDIQNNFEFDLDLLSINNNNLSTSDVSILPINNLASSTSSSPSHIGNSSLFSSLCTSNSTTSLSNSILPNQNNQDNMSLEQELHQIQANILQDYFYSRTLNEKNVVSNMCNENILGTQVLDPVNTSVIKNNELRVPTSNTVHVEKQTKIQDKNQSELNSGNDLMEVINTNSTQSFEPIPDVVQNNNYSFKRLLYEESESPRKKLQKNNINKNEDGKRTTSPIEHTFNTIQPFSSSPINTNSTITIGFTHTNEYRVNQFSSIDIDTNLEQNNSTTSTQSSTGMDINKDYNDVAAPFIDNMLIDNAHSMINSSICQSEMLMLSDNIQLNMLDPTTSNIIRSDVNMSNSMSITDYQHHDVNKSFLVYKNINRQGDTESSSFDTTSSSSNNFVNIDSEGDQHNLNLNVDKSLINSDQNNYYPSTEKDNDKILSQIYKKLILSDAIVMSKSDVYAKLKHVPTSPRIREQAINNLVKDKLLVVGDWFSSKNTKGIIYSTGYLKGYPENDAQNQIQFANTLAKYAIDFFDFEQSFRKDEVVGIPRTLGASDIKQSKWLYSQAL
ncbi:unnamed protein product, partial [Adineta steineri]